MNNNKTIKKIALTGIFIVSVTGFFVADDKIGAILATVVCIVLYFLISKIFLDIKKS